MSQRSLAVTRAVQEGAPDPAGEQQRLITQLTNLVPAESLALFVALIAATANYSYDTKIAMFWVVLGLTPLYIWFNYVVAAKPDDAANIPLFEMLIGSAAFVIWSLSVPSAPFADKVPIIGGTLSAQDGVIWTLVASAALGFLVAGRPAFGKFLAAWRKRRQRPATLEPQEPPQA